MANASANLGSRCLAFTTTVCWNITHLFRFRCHARGIWWCFIEATRPSPTNLSRCSRDGLGGLLIQISTHTIASIGLVLTSAGGGFLALPLYTLLQDDVTAVANRIAVNNIANAYMIIVAAIASILVVGFLGLPLLIWLLVLSVGQLFLCLYHRTNLSFS